MSVKRTLLLTSVSLFAVAYHGKADELFDNLGAAPCCVGPVVSRYPYGDSFSTGASAFDFDSVTVMLTADEGIPPADLTITALLFGDSSTSPGSLLETIGTLNESAVAPGQSQGHTFASAAPYLLAPHTRYWIELTSNETASSNGFFYVGWLLSPTLSGTVGTSGQYWYADQGEPPPLVFADGTNGGPMLMEVSGTTAASAPEPSTFAFALLGAALACLGLRNRFNKSEEVADLKCREPRVPVDKPSSVSGSDIAESHAAGGRGRAVSQMQTLFMAGLLAAFGGTVAPAKAATIFTPVNISRFANFSWVEPETDPDGQRGVYLPGGPTGEVTLDGVTFGILSNAAGLQAWNANVAADNGDHQESITIPVGVFGVTAVDTLLNTYWGVSGASVSSLVFTGSNGASSTDNLVGNDDIRNWCCTQTINGTSTINVFSVGASGVNGDPGFLDMQHIVLPVSFSTQALVSVELIDNGGYGESRDILDGITVQSTGISAAPEPGTLATIGLSIVALYEYRRRKTGVSASRT